MIFVGYSALSYQDFLVDRLGWDWTHKFVTEDRTGRAALIGLLVVALDVANAYNRRGFLSQWGHTLLWVCLMVPVAGLFVALNGTA